MLQPNGVSHTIRGNHENQTLPALCSLGSRVPMFLEAMLVRRNGRQGPNLEMSNYSKIDCFRVKPLGSIWLARWGGPCACQDEVSNLKHRKPHFCTSECGDCRVRSLGDTGETPSPGAGSGFFPWLRWARTTTLAQGYQKIRVAVPTKITSCWSLGKGAGRYWFALQGTATGDPRGPASARPLHKQSANRKRAVGSRS